jgi:uncharacterized DUF497 family protein
MSGVFEYDFNKSNSNKEKHGIDFEEAQRIWEDSFAITVPTQRVEEVRFIIVGMIAKKTWSAIFTMRQDKIRIISARRSRTEEVYHYEKNKSQ